MSKHNQPSFRSLPKLHAFPNRRLFPWVSTVFAGLLAVSLFGGVSAALIYQNLNNQFQDSVIDTRHLGATPDETPVPIDSFEGRAVNILVTGIDSRYGDNGDMGAGTSDEIEAIRSDTNLLVHLSADRTRASVVSIPRDLMVDIPACALADGTMSYAQYGMFNSAFSTGAVVDDVAAGVACTESTVEDLTGVEVDGFVVVDFAGFDKVLESFGGVDLCVEEDIDDAHTGLVLSSGCQHLSAEQAGKFARVRYGVGNDGSDIGRIGRQQQLFGAMMKQVFDSNMLTDLPKLYAFVQELLANVNVSSSLGNARADVGLMNSIRSMGTENIRFVTLPWTAYEYDSNRVVEAQPLADQLWESLQNDTELPPGIEFKDMDNNLYITGDDGQTYSVDEYGNPIYPDAQSEETESTTGSSDTQG